MKNLTIAVWGNKCSGKSTLAAALAKALTKYFRTVLLTNADKYSPAFAIWGVPRVNDKRTISIADIMTEPNITSDFLNHHITLCPASDKIGLCGYLTTDDCELYEPISGNAAQSFLAASKETAQITIVDCTVPQDDALTEKALKTADIVIILIEPNAAGIGFVFAQHNFINHNLIDNRRYIYAASKTSPISAVAEFESKLGVHFLPSHLPFTDEVRDKLTSLELFNEYSGEYSVTVNSIAEIIKEESKSD